MCVCVASTVDIGISPLNSPMNYLGIVTYFAWTWAAAAFQWQRGSAIRFIGQMMEQQVDRCRCRYGIYVYYIWLCICWIYLARVMYELLYFQFQFRFQFAISRFFFLAVFDFPLRAAVAAFGVLSNHFVS